MILEAAKSIIAATSALVRAASAAQRELIDQVTIYFYKYKLNQINLYIILFYSQGKVARRPLHSSDDGQWSEGLVSAARLTAAAAHSLAESANALVQGLGSEERLVSAAKQVAGSTAQLLVACKVGHFIHISIFKIKFKFLINFFKSRSKLTPTLNQQDVCNLLVMLSSNPLITLFELPKKLFLMKKNAVLF